MREARTRLVYEVMRRLQRGDAKRAIAKALGIDRKTVTRIIADVHKRRDEGDDALARELPAPRTPRPSKLDAFTDVIAQLLAEYPDIRATRLHEELCERGFDGGYTIVREHLRKLQPKPGKKPRMLVLTGPGKQGQFDWSPYTLADGSPIYLFCCVLSYSRDRYAHFCTDMRQPTVFRELRRSFDHHVGIAGEYVTDSMPGIVDRWENDEPILNLRAVDFAVFYGFSLHIAPRADGAYKGKVERTFRHTVESFFNARTFHTLQEANDTLAWWLEHRCNGVKHGRTGRKPVEMLAEEREHLQPLPAHPYDDRELGHRIVDSYCYVHFDGNFYLAPKRYVGKWVYVRASDELVEVVADAATVVARHARAQRNAGAYVPPPAQDSSGPRRRPVAELLAALAQWGPAAATYGAKVRDHKRYPAVQLSRLLELRSTWALTDIVAAIEHASRYQAWDADAVGRILSARYRPRTLEDHIAASPRAHIRAAMAQSPVEQRDMQAMARLLAGPASDPGAPGSTVPNKEGDDDNQAT